MEIINHFGIKYREIIIKEKETERKKMSATYLQEFVVDGPMILKYLDKGRNKRE